MEWGLWLLTSPLQVPRIGQWCPVTSPLAVLLPLPEAGYHPEATFTVPKWRTIRNPILRSTAQTRKLTTDAPCLTPLTRMTNKLTGQEVVTNRIL